MLQALIQTVDAGVEGFDRVMCCQWLRRCNRHAFCHGATVRMVLRNCAFGCGGISSRARNAS